MKKYTTGFALVEAPRQFRFPADHGPHPAYRSEWWYFTGNVATRSGRAFGFQLTFFRFALSPEAPQLPATRWATRQAYMAHLAISDVENRRFYAFERFDRNALGLAGAQPRPFRVWLGDWQVRGADRATFPLVLSEPLSSALSTTTCTRSLLHHLMRMISTRRCRYRHSMQLS